MSTGAAEGGDASEQYADVWAALEDMATDTNSGAAVGNSVDVIVATEMATFFSEPLLPRTQDSLLWWRVNEHRFPVLATVARAYLATPPSSVQSERIFSTAGDTLNEHRTRLTADNAERLIFLKFNLPPTD